MFITKAQRILQNLNDTWAVDEINELINDFTNNFISESAALSDLKAIADVAIFA